jgi:hypothetical protein
MTLCVILEGFYSYNKGNVFLAIHEMNITFLILGILSLLVSHGDHHSAPQKSIFYIQIAQ